MAVQEGLLPQHSHFWWDKRHEHTLIKSSSCSSLSPTGFPLSCSGTKLRKELLPPSLLLPGMTYHSIILCKHCSLPVGFLMPVLKILWSSFCFISDARNLFILCLEQPMVKFTNPNMLHDPDRLFGGQKRRPSWQSREWRVGLWRGGGCPPQGPSFLSSFTDTGIEVCQLTQRQHLTLTKTRMKIC